MDKTRFIVPESRFFFGFSATKASQNRMAGSERPNDEKESGKDCAERGWIAAGIGIGKSDSYLFCVSQ